MLKRFSRWIKWLLFVAWFLFLFVIGAEVAQQNPQLVELKLLFWILPEASTGVVFTCTLLVGVVLGLFAFLPGFLYLKFKLRSVQKKLDTLQAAAGASQVLPKVD